MTPSQALTYAIDWLRAFPTLPTSAPHVREERAEAVRVLVEMAKEHVTDAYKMEGK